MLTGHAAFEGLGEFELMKAQVEERAVPVRQIIPDLPEAVDEAIMRSLEKAPDHRFQRASDFIAALLPILRDLAQSEFHAGFSHASDSDRRRAFRKRGGLKRAVNGSRARQADMPTERLEAITAVDAPTGLTETIPALPSRQSPPASSPSHRIPHIGEQPEPHPQEIGKYRILETIGEGPVGPLYQAYDRLYERPVALKVISRDFPVATKERDRFFRAGRVWRQLDHPNVVRIYDLDFWPDVAFIAMELLRGTDLGHVIQYRKGIPLEDKLKIMIQVCNGLHHIHEHGVIHRDIRPKNIFLLPSVVVKILDSHISRDADHRKEELTMVGEVLGDWKYIAPEQARGNPSYCSDIFSAGALFCDLLTYQIPAGLDPRERLDALQSLGPSIPQELRDIVKRALSPDPAQRFSDLHEMARRIEKLERSVVPNIVPPGTAKKHSSVTPKPQSSRIVFTLHGIRTHAVWQRAFAEVAANANWRCRLDRWNFGYFSLLRFLLPRQRRTRVEWFRKTYRDEVQDRDLQLDESNPPCIVAHSFGTYILGNALLSYDYLRFDEIILCGSILPTNFPWHELIDRGQVQAVRNEYGTRDFWTGIVSWFVRGAGPSGIHGFTCRHFLIESFRTSRRGTRPRASESRTCHGPCISSILWRFAWQPSFLQKVYGCHEAQLQ